MPTGWPDKYCSSNLLFVQEAQNNSFEKNDYIFSTAELFLWKEYFRSYPHKHWASNPFCISWCARRMGRCHDGTHMPKCCQIHFRLSQGNLGRPWWAPLNSESYIGTRCKEKKKTHFRHTCRFLRFSPLETQLRPFFICLLFAPLSTVSSVLEISI